MRHEQDAEPVALWIESRGHAALRPASASNPAPDEVRVRALTSGISRGTEALVFHGEVPGSEWARMRCPFQDGDFPFPVKYGYAVAGQIEAGPSERVGQRVLCLHPHQSLFTLPASWALPIPDSVTTERAVLAPQMETALNATWDAGPRIGDRIAVVGAGVIGCLVACLCARIPGTAVTLIDSNPERSRVAMDLGVDFAAPDFGEAGTCDLVFHCSGAPTGLTLALSLCGFEATIIELSWYGTKPVAVALGGAFHSQRLTLRASQVGAVSDARRARRTHAERLTLALALCADARLDSLVRDETPLAEMPERLGAILGTPGTLCHRIRYPDA